MPHHARVAIGVPVRNGGDYLAEALQSILAQDHDDLLVLVSDNASDDNTWEVCQEFARRDPRVEVMRSDTNRGAAWNYNRVFAASEGRCDHFKWAAHDDVLAPGFVRRCVEVLQREPDAVLAYPRTTIIDAHGAPLGDLEYDLDAAAPRRTTRFASFHRFFARLRNFHCNPVFGVFRREALARTRGIGAYWGSDAVLLGEVVLLGRCVEVAERLFDRREHPGRSMRRHRTTRAIAEWFDPLHPQAVSMPQWRCLREHLAGLRRAPLTWAERLRCRYTVLRAVHLRALVREVRRGMRARGTPETDTQVEPEPSSPEQQETPPQRLVAARATDAGPRK